MSCSCLRLMPFCVVCSQVQTADLTLALNQSGWPAPFVATLDNGTIPANQPAWDTAPGFWDSVYIAQGYIPPTSSGGGRRGLTEWRNGITLDFVVSLSASGTPSLLTTRSKVVLLNNVQVTSSHVPTGPADLYPEIVIRQAVSTFTSQTSTTADVRNSCFFFFSSQTATV